MPTKRLEHDAWQIRVEFIRHRNGLGLPVAASQAILEVVYQTPH
jgi:hypothetical protein